MKEFFPAREKEISPIQVVAKNGIKYKMMEKALRGYLKSIEFPCPGYPNAKQHLSMEIFSEMGTSQSALVMWNNIYEFLGQLPSGDHRSCFTHFIIFDEIEIETEEHFENLLIRQLDQGPGSGVTKLTLAEKFLYAPYDPDFRVIIGRYRVWILGMHQKTPRKNRRFPWPMLIFHPEPTH